MRILGSIILVFFSLLLFSCKEDVEKSQIDLLTDSFWILDKAEGVNASKFIEGVIIEGTIIELGKDGRYANHLLGVSHGPWELDETKQKLILMFIGTSLQRREYQIVTLDERSLVLSLDDTNYYFRHRENGDLDTDPNAEKLLTNGAWWFKSKDGTDTLPLVSKFEGTRLVFSPGSTNMAQIDESRLLNIMGGYYIHPKIYQLTYSSLYNIYTYRIVTLNDKSLVMSRDGVTYTFEH